MGTHLDYCRFCWPVAGGTKVIMGDTVCSDLVADSLDFLHHRNSHFVLPVLGCDFVRALE